MVSALDLLTEWLAEGELRTARQNRWSGRFFVRLDMGSGYRKKRQHFYGENVDLDAAIRAAVEKARKG